MSEYPDFVFSGMWVVNPATVNIDDLVRARPGMIVRAYDVSDVRYIPNSEPWDFVAGMVSENA